MRKIYERPTLNVVKVENCSAILTGSQRGQTEDWEDGGELGGDDPAPASTLWY